MLSKTQEKLITSLHQKKYRQESGLCLVEGGKAIQTAGKAIDFVFTRIDTERFESLVTTETPQDIAAIARIPRWSQEDVERMPIMVVLDGIQDPGNVGSALRLCLAFNASLILIESADPTSPKCIRASAGAMFLVPWRELAREGAEQYLNHLGRKMYRLEKREGAKELSSVEKSDRLLLIAGSEGSGITLHTKADSIYIGHSPLLESLNVAKALAIALYRFSR